MKFALTQETDLDNKKVSSIHALSKMLSEYFVNKYYGEQIKEILIGIITINPNYGGGFFKARKPRFIEFQRVKNGIGEWVEISKILTFDVRIDYQSAVFSEEYELQKLVLDTIIDTVSNIRLPKKVIGFNVRLFESDLKQFGGDF